MFHILRTSSVKSIAYISLRPSPTPEGCTLEPDSLITLCFTTSVMLRLQHLAFISGVIVRL